MLPCHIISAALGFPCEDQKLWWEDTAPLLAGFSAMAKYDIHAQYRHLLFHYTLVLPSLGPFSNKGVRTAMPGNQMFELSMNVQNDKLTVRFDFEPRVSILGTSQSQSNTSAMDNLLFSLARPGINTNQHLYHCLRNEFALTETDMTTLETLKTDHLATTQYVVAWDLKGLDSSMKLAKADPEGRYLMSMLPLQAYVEEKMIIDDIWIFSWDCVKPGQVTLESLDDIWTLGGRLMNPAIVKGLELLNNLWRELQLPQIGDRKCIGADCLKSHANQTVGIPMTITYEVLPGGSPPLPKAYLPLFNKNDMKVANVLVKFWKQLGWTSQANSYIANLSSNYPHLDSCHTNQVQDCVSFAFSEDKGPYMTVYFRTSLTTPENV
ncbi:hypothetical protein N7444_012872 [Penicillium canescens]|nr:hypothetical protein N7444_012872 [Penicillium canescens]